MVSLFSCGYGTKDNEDDSFASVPVNTDPEVLACFTQVNEFRTGSEIKPDLQLSSNSWGSFYVSFSAIELSNFAVNSAYKDKHPELNRIGHN